MYIHVTIYTIHILCVKLERWLGWQRLALSWIYTKLFVFDPLFRSYIIYTREYTTHTRSAYCILFMYSNDFIFKLMYVSPVYNVIHRERGKRKQTCFIVLLSRFSYFVRARVFVSRQVDNNAIACVTYYLRLLPFGCT